MLFKKNDSANLVSKLTKYWKNRPLKTKEAQHFVSNLKSRIPLLFYCVKHIHGQFKTYLKLRNIHFGQIAKTICDILLKPFCFVSYIDISISTILFLLICHVFFGVLLNIIYTYHYLLIARLQSTPSWLIFVQLKFYILHSLSYCARNRKLSMIH
jgi:hypothetical protein